MPALDWMFYTIYRLLVLIALGSWRPYTQFAFIFRANYRKTHILEGFLMIPGNGILFYAISVFYQSPGDASPGSFPLGPNGEEHMSKSSEIFNGHILKRSTDPPPPSVRFQQDIHP